MVLHVREMIHRVGNLDRFKKIVKMALTAESSLTGLGFGKAMQGAQHAHATQPVPQNSQYDTMNAMQSMLRRVKDDIEKKILGKDEHTNIFKALS